jgi:hypothetical protein
MPVSRWHAAMRRLRLLPPPRGKGRFKRYTVGRAIEREQVHEICPLGLKHGMQLVAISGVNGVLSDEDSEQVRGCAGRRWRRGPNSRRWRQRSCRCGRPCGANL